MNGRIALRCAAFALAALGAPGARASAQATSAPGGYVLSQRVTAEGYPQMTMRLKTLQGKVRVEMDAPNAPGIYFVLQPANRVAVVTPSQRMIMMMDPAQMATGQAASAALGTSAVTNVIVDVVDAGPGETLLGHPTHKYMVRQRYTVTVTMDGKPHPTIYDATVEEWIATDLAGYTDGLDKFTDAFGNSFSGVRGGSARELISVLKTKGPKGFPLKTIVTEKSTVSGGQLTTAVTTCVVTSYGKAPVTASEFVLPPDFQVQDLAKMTGRK